MVRAVLIVLTILLSAAATAQTPSITGLIDREVCASLGVSEDPSDIDTGSCRPFVNFNELDSQGRIIWVRGRLTIGDSPSDTAPLAFFTGALASRDIWWNGQRIGAVGRPGISPESETPGDLDAVTWIPPDLVRAGDNTVAIRYSTFNLDLPVMSPLHYAYAGRLRGRDLLIAYGPTLAVTGALVAAALFFGLSYISDRRSLGPLFISLMCLFAVGQLWLESLRGFASFPYPMQIWRLVGIAGLAFGFALSLTAYVATRFTPRRWAVHVAGAAVLGVVLIPFMPGFDGVTLGLIIGPTAVSLAAAVQGLAARRPGATVTAVALSFFLAMQFIQRASFLDNTLYLAVGLLALVLFVDQALDLHRARKAAAEASNRAALLELELLRRRIAPHFLMNTLSALAEWVESDPKTGVKMIEALAEEFRLLSQISDQPLIRLGDEIALCRRHLEVMSYRVDRPFSLATRDVDENAEVPPGVLHTLIENAFTHGRFADGGEFVLTREAGEGASRLVLITPPSVRPELPEEPARPAGGEGLAYVRRRLEAAFGASARVESAASGAGWRTVLTIPAT
jgi:MFS family permease